MQMSPGLRKLALTAHVTSSVGWLGSIAAFLGLALVGIAGRDAQKARSAYVAMELTGWYVIMPLSFASLATGLIQSLGTTWGLFRHYWVLAKLLINLLATTLLLVHMRPISHMATIALDPSRSPFDHRQLQIQLVADAGLAVVALLVATVLSIYKPRGLTPYGRRKWKEQRSPG